MTGIKDLSRTLVVMVLLSSAPLTSARAIPLFDLGVGGATAGVGLGRTFGFEFSISSPLLVDGLGFWDDYGVGNVVGSAGAGLGQVGGYQVGLWNSAGVLQASTTITNVSTVVASANLNGQWLYNYFTPFAIGPGNYRLGAFQSVSGADLVRYDQLLTATNPAFTFVESRVVNAGVLADPINFAGGLPPLYFGPNLSTAGVPEPTTALLPATGLAAMAIRRRTRAR